MKNEYKCHKITFILLIIGGINWLLVGALGWDIGEFFGGQEAIVSRIIYILVGLAAIKEIFMHRAICCCCSQGSCCKDGKCGHNHGKKFESPNTPAEDMDMAK